MLVIAHIKLSKIVVNTNPWTISCTQLFFNQTTNHCGSDRYDEHKLVVNDGLSVECGEAVEIHITKDTSKDSNNTEAEFGTSDDVVHTSVRVENDIDTLVE